MLHPDRSSAESRPADPRQVVRLYSHKTLDCARRDSKIAFLGATAFEGELTFVNGGFREYSTYSWANVEIPEWLIRVQKVVGRFASARRQPQNMLKPALPRESDKPQDLDLALFAHQWIQRERLQANASA
jgi:hypothetical protein